MAMGITADRLQEARDAAIEALDASHSVITKWQQQALNLQAKCKSATWQADFAAVVRARQRLLAALTPELLSEIESRSAITLPPVRFREHTFTLAHEAAKKAVSLAIMFGEHLACDVGSAGWRKDVGTTALFCIWEAEEHAALIARVKREWEVTSDTQA